MLVRPDKLRSSSKDKKFIFASDGRTCVSVSIFRSKTPSHSYLDLGLEKEFQLQSFRLPQSMSLVVRIDVFNVLDSQEPISPTPSSGPSWGLDGPFGYDLLSFMMG